MEYSERYKIGFQKLKEIDGSAGEKVVDSLKDISPDLARFIIEYPFGDIYANNKLDTQSQEIIVVSALAAIGAVEPQLKVHFNSALNVGCTINEIHDVILQLLQTAGFPKCINAMYAFDDVLQKRKEEGIIDEVGEVKTTESSDSTRYQKGKDMMNQMDSFQFDILNNAYGEITPELLKYILEFVYGDIISRTNLNPKKRQLAIIASFAALGNATPQLKAHINMGFNLGLTIDDVKEIMLLISVYAGFPASVNGMYALKKVITE